MLTAIHGVIASSGGALPFTAVVTPLDYASSNTINVDAAFEVDWGDGVFVPYSAGDAIAIASNSDTGIITVQSANEPTWIKFVTDTFTDIDLTESSSITKMDDICYFLSEVTAFAMADASKVTTMRQAFYNCYNLLSFPLIDTSSVTDFYFAWYNMWLITSFPAFDTSSGENFDYTWGDCWALISMPDPDTSKATTMTGTWQQNDQMTAFPNVDTSLAENLDWCFSSIAIPTTVPTYNTSSALNMDAMFAGCSGITGAFPFMTTTLCTNFKRLWWDCSGVTSFPAIDTSIGTDFNQMFRGITATSLPAYDTSLGLDFGSMFQDAASLVCLTSVDTATSGTTAVAMFTGCTAMTAPSAGEQTTISTVPGGLDYVNSSPCPLPAFKALATPLDFGVSDNTVTVTGDAYEVDWGDGVFLPYADGAPATAKASNSDTGIITVRGPNTITHCDFSTNTYTAIDVQASSSLTSLDASFGYLTNMTSFAIDDTSNVLTMSSAFAGCTGLTTFPAIDLTSCTVANQAWYGTTGMTTFNAPTNTSGIANWSQTFYDAGIVNVPAIDMSGGTNFTFTFYSMANVVSIGSLNMTAPTADFSNMFGNNFILRCLADVDTTNATATTSMFANCPLMEGPDASEQTLLLAGASYTNAGICPAHTWKSVGTDLSVSGANGGTQLCELTATDIVCLDWSNLLLRTYSFDGSTWSLVGTGLDMAALGYSSPKITGLNSTDIAIHDGSTVGTVDALRTYRFNGATWSQVGNSFSLDTGSANTAIGSLTSSQIAIYESVGGLLQAYTFDGTDWTATGTGFSIGTVAGACDMAGYTATDVAFTEGPAGDLTTYRFGGSTWTVIGNTFSTGAGGFTPAMAPMDSSSVAYFESTSEDIRSYSFDGTDWTDDLGRLSLPISTIAPSMAHLTSTRVVIYDISTDLLRAFDYTI